MTSLAQSTRSKILFESVRAVDPSQSLDAVCDVLVDDGVIRSLGAPVPDSQRADAMVVSGHGKWLFPGFVEVHAHLREPGFEYKEDIASGLRAAAAGGYSHVCAMPNTSPVNDTRAVTELMLARAAASGLATHLHPVSAITVGLRGEQLVEMGDQKSAGAVAVSDDGKCLLDSGVMRAALEYASTFELPVMQHAEDHSLTRGAQMNEGKNSTMLGLRGWPRAAEEAIIARDIALVEMTGARYHAQHISTKGSVALIREAKRRGLPVTAEVTPHHLMLDDSRLRGYDTVYKVAPPLREPADIEALRAALDDGTIDCIATDHAPHSAREKQVAFSDASPGMIGLEFSLPLMLELVRTGALSLERVLTALTSSPAKLIGIRAPTLKQGAPASLLLVDPDKQYVLSRKTLRSKSYNTPWLGKPLRGRVLMTLTDGYLTHRASVD